VYTASPMTLKTRPVLMLNSRAAQRVGHGYPWIFGSDVNNAEQLGKVAVVDFAAPNGRVIASGYAHPKIQLMGRVLSRDKAEFDMDFFVEKFRAAQNWREQNFSNQCYRLVHAESDGLPGLVIDRFGDTLAVQVNTAGMELLRDVWLPALESVTGAKNIVFKNDGNTRALEGLEEKIETVKGKLPKDGLVELIENDVKFYADLKEGQKTGWFYDQRPHRAWVAARAKGKTIIDVFCHTGGFGIMALAQGASHATFVDTSAAAIALTKKNAALNNVEARSEFIEGKAFDVLEKMSTQFDIVCVDPPAFVKVKKDMAVGLKGYEKLAKLAAPLVKPGGILFYASCSSHPTEKEILDAVITGTGKAGREAALVYSGMAGADHPMHPTLPETRYLKAFAFRL
jgi:23S rRNA (cytosine1962-C5)-methyltransferase